MSCYLVDMLFICVYSVIIILENIFVIHYLVKLLLYTLNIKIYCVEKQKKNYNLL